MTAQTAPRTRFAVDHDAARDWLTGPGADRMIPAGWRGWRATDSDPDRDGRISCLIEDATHGAGILPPDATSLEYEHERGRFRWVVRTDGATLATPWRPVEAMVDGRAYGLGAAVAILSAAVDAGNRLLDAAA